MESLMFGSLEEKQKHYGTCEVRSSIVSMQNGSCRFIAKFYSWVFRGKATYHDGNVK